MILMEPNTQIEKNNTVVQENVVADNQKMQQSNNQEGIIAPGVIDKPLIKKKKNNILLIVIVLVLVVGGAYFMINKGNGNGIGFLAGGNKDGEGNVKVDTGEKWGDSFALYFQDFHARLLYDEDAEKAKEKASIERNFEILFIDFNFDGTPEMLVKYIDNANNQVIKIMNYANEEVSETKDFQNATFRLVYSLKEKDVKWYIYINNGTNGSRSGAYTEVIKLIKGIAYDSDIKAYTDREVASFNDNYVLGSYKYSFYKIEDATFADDFKTAVDKYEGNNKDINVVKEKLLNDYANVEAPEEPVNNDPYLVVGDFTLEFGKYVHKKDVLQNGEVVGEEDVIVTINRDGTITDGSKKIKYNIYGKTFSLENGISFKVTDNNKFNYGAGAGLEYIYAE